MDDKSHYEFLNQFTVPELKKIISKIKKDFTAHFKGYGKIKDKDQLIVLILEKYIVDEENFAKMKYGGNIQDIFKKREDRMQVKESKKKAKEEAKKTMKMSKEKEARLAKKVKEFLSGDETIDFSNKEDIKGMKLKKGDEEDKIFEVKEKKKIVEPKKEEKKKYDEEDEEYEYQKKPKDAIDAWNNMNFVEYIEEFDKPFYDKLFNWIDNKVSKKQNIVNTDLLGLTKKYNNAVIDRFGKDGFQILLISLRQLVETIADNDFMKKHYFEADKKMDNITNLGKYFSLKNAKIIVKEEKIKDAIDMWGEYNFLDYIMKNDESFYNTFTTWIEKKVEKKNQLVNTDLLGLTKKYNNAVIDRFGGEGYKLLLTGIKEIVESVVDKDDMKKYYFENDTQLDKLPLRKYFTVANVKKIIDKN